MGSLAKQTLPDPILFTKRKPKLALHSQDPMRSDLRCDGALVV